MRKVGKILRRETDDYTDFEGGVPRKAPVRRTRRTAAPAAQRRTTTRRVAAPKEKIEIGQMANIRITEVYPHTLGGELA